MLPLYLALKEMARNKRRFSAVFLIVALITLLVLFTSALGDGLSLGASEYFDRMGSELVVFQKDVDYQLQASRLGRSRLSQIRRVPGVAAVGPVGVSTAAIIAVNGAATDGLDVALIGVEPGEPGAPAAYAGEALNDSRAAHAVLDRHVVERLGIPLGATITLKVVQGMEEQLYDLRVQGFAEGRKVNYIPSIFVPLRRWERIRPQETPGGNEGADLLFNIAAVKLDQTAPPDAVAAAIERTVSQVEVTDPVTAYRTTQGYNDMQSTISMQQGFMLLIVVLIVGSFFQIQTLQKVAQIGMLEAIGASSRMVITTLLIQIMITLVVGLAIGGAVMWAMAQVLPATVPIVFSGTKITITILSLFAAGPAAAMVAARTILKIEPLRALGLSG
ncbi:FtsX-like permease family protein [Oscillochloris sp. ZM17-4]|uniref:ABC transporter permease n=1 Tax=Oscillochloris sp. ZM17-4 TaxID=2866714 RepID=UPI001C72B74E|nr:FtsX-like permease family protein [Oscillochloris sp. ZM17-4]MBX0328969.1 FtsX-like permease family protein [Oscillochloris sp. ZM17-4]